MVPLSFPDGYPPLVRFWPTLRVTKQVRYNDAIAVVYAFNEQYVDQTQDTVNTPQHIKLLFESHLYIYYTTLLLLSQYALEMT